MNPVNITAGPFKVIDGVVAGGMLAAGSTYAGVKVWNALHAKPGEDSFSKGKFAAYMLGSVATVGAFVAADKTGALDALARVANDAGRGALMRGGAAALSGSIAGAGVCAIPGALLATGWGWIALAAPEN